MSTTIKTVREVWEALDRNGFEHLRGAWYSEFGSKVGGCVLAQTGYNLGVIVTDDESGYFGLGDYLEDNWGREPLYTLYNALNKFHVNLKEEDKWYREDTDTDGAAELIVRWNDALVKDKDGTPTGEYELKTYKEVSNMAYDILEPFFEEEVKLTVYDYKSHFKVVA